MGDTVLNKFEQTPGPLGKNDNKFVADGTVETSEGYNLKSQFITVTVGPLDTSADIFRFVPGFTGTIKKMTTVLNKVITGGSNTVISATVGGGSKATPGVTINASSALGATDSASPTVNNTFSSSQAIVIDTNGGTTTTTATVTLTLELVAD